MVTALPRLRYHLSPNVHGKGHRLSGETSKKSLAIRFGKTVIRIFQEKDVSGLAQQFAYNLLFAVAPLLMFLTAFSGLVVRQVNSDIQNPVQPILDWLDANLPADAAQFLRDPVESALTVDPTFLLSFGGLLTLWAAKNAMTSVMK